MLSPRLAAVALLGLTAAARAEPFHVTPAAVTLEGNLARVQLVVTAGDTVNEKSADLTHRAAYRSSRPEVVTVSETGRLLAVCNGQAAISVSVDSVSRSVPVTVSGVVAVPQVSF